MLAQRVREWLWQGTLEPHLELLPVDNSLDPSDVHDLVSESVRGLVAGLEAEIATLQRRRAAEQVTAGPVESGRGDAELRNLAKGLLPSLDALDRIIEFGDSYEQKAESFENWLTSVKALRTRLLRTLETIGLTAINSVGTEVDLEFHDVVAVVPAGNFPANTVVSEQQRGYLFRSKLLRDAKVVVAQ
ncbi:nucleotide exchange factor GrpE [bacterium]|nr:nucleotide exchange factor GrpE [bacterium]